MLLNSSRPGDIYIHKLELNYGPRIAQHFQVWELDCQISNWPCNMNSPNFSFGERERVCSIEFWLRRATPQDNFCAHRCYICTYVVYLYVYSMRLLPTCWWCVSEFRGAIGCILYFACAHFHLRRPARAYTIGRRRAREQSSLKRQGPVSFH